MGRNRKTFTDSFKKEVALEALKERITVNEIAAKYGISGSMVSNWKKQFLSGGFSNPNSRSFVTMRADNQSRTDLHPLHSSACLSMDTQH